MSNCLSLISCDGTCSNIYNIQGASRTLLLPYIDNLVQINNDTDCTYYVRENFFVGFEIDSTDFLCDITSTTGITSFSAISYTVDSIIYNGVQYINNRRQYAISFGDYQCLRCNDLNLGNAICSTSPAGVPTANGYNNNNAHSRALNRIFQNLNLDLEVFPYGVNGSTAFRLFNDDQFQIEITRLGPYNPGTYELTFNNLGLSVTFNGNPITDNIVNETTDTCTIKSSRFTVQSVISASTCNIPSNFPDYVNTSDCDVLTLFPLGVECLITNTFQSSGATRTATLVVTGGTPPYTFEWENGNRTDTIRNLPAGTYNATVTDYFGDFVVNTSCELPPIDCSLRNIVTNLSYTCQFVSGLTNGFANLNISSSGGIRPYTYTGTINGTPTAFTNNVVVSNADLIVVNTTDRDGCTGTSRSIAINCPISGPPPPPPLICGVQVLCPNSNTFSLSVSATTEVTPYIPLLPPTIPNITFNFNLSSPSGYNGILFGSYKIYDLDFPNTFLNTLNNFPQSPIFWTGYSQYAEFGTPSVKLNNYVEFGFTQLTPNNPGIFDDPWRIRTKFWTQYYSGTTYQTPLNGTFWTPGTTSIKIEVTVCDEDFCVHTGSGFITIPLNNSTNNITINF